MASPQELDKPGLEDVPPEEELERQRQLREDAALERLRLEEALDMPWRGLDKKRTSKHTSDTDGV